MRTSKDHTGFIKSFTGSHRLVLDFLIEEVLGQQPESIQNFLLPTAVLNRLTGSLCDALTGQENSQEILEMLDHANLFIVPLDEERRWYRYHRLFADLLRQRLRQTTPEQAPGLHIRAFMASYTQEDMQKVIQHAREALEYLPEQEPAWRSPTLIVLGDAYESQGQMVAAHKVRLEALATGKASGDTYIFVIVNLRLAEVLRQQGKLQQVIDICEHMMKKAEESGISETPLVGLLLGIWGEVLAEINDLDKAIDLTKKGVKLTERGGDVWYNVLSNLYLVRVPFFQAGTYLAQKMLSIRWKIPLAKPICIIWLFASYQLGKRVVGWHKVN